MAFIGKKRAVRIALLTKLDLAWAISPSRSRKESLLHSLVSLGQGSPLSSMPFWEKWSATPRKWLSTAKLLMQVRTLGSSTTVSRTTFSSESPFSKADTRGLFSILNSKLTLSFSQWETKQLLARTAQLFLEDKGQEYPWLELSMPRRISTYWTIF